MAHLPLGEPPLAVARRRWPSWAWAARPSLRTWRAPSGRTAWQRPVEVIRDYDLPAWVGSETLVVASSYSGATEETVSCLGTALERRCPVAVMTTGGPMREVAERAGLPVAVFPAPARRVPRWATRWGSSAGLLERAGVLRIDEAEIAAGVAAAQALVERCRPDVPTGDNPAKQLAWSLVDRLVIIIAGGFLAPVARRWKAQLNENGKSTAVFEELPEATHNTVVGLEQPESVRDHLFVVTLDGASIHPRTRLRARLVRELLDVAGIVAPRGRGARRAPSRAGTLGRRAGRPRERLPRLHLRGRPNAGGGHRLHQGEPRRRGPQSSPGVGTVGSRGGPGSSAGRRLACRPSAEGATLGSVIGAPPRPTPRRPATRSPSPCPMGPGGDQRCTPASSARSRRPIAMPASSIASPWSG